ncbi:MAG: hypothetical protein P1V20_14825 [Verrucomicrobiales bacterium]|nr:hypothetical protein [Verrucomicrobiales bacterium]
MYYIDFTGGLGDIFLKIYRTNSYRYLETTSEITGVLFASGNPHAVELLRYHPNRNRILLYDLTHIREHFLGEGFRGEALLQQLYTFAEIPTGEKPSSVHSPPPENWLPLLDPPDFIDDSGHLIFQPFAGSSDRSLPANQIKELLAFFGTLSRSVYIVSRDFLRIRSGKVVHSLESLPDVPLPDNVLCPENLSVPATLDLLRSASGFIGTHSSIVLAAAYENIPSLIWYPERLNEDFQNHRSYAFYSKYEHMTCLPIITCGVDSASSWIQSEHLSPDRFHQNDTNPHRDLARWIISRGGTFQIDLPERNRRVVDTRSRREPLREIPRGRFFIWRVSFSGQSGFGDKQLAEFRIMAEGITTITNVNLSRTRVSGKGISFLTSLEPSLRKLDLSDTQVTREDIRQLQDHFPGCTVLGMK